MKSGNFPIPVATVVLMSTALGLAACGGGSSSGGSGGGSSPPPPPPASIVVQPSSFDFGLVTEGNLEDVPARRFTIRNNGTSTFSLSSIRLEGGESAEFELDVEAGSSPCGTAPVTLAPEASCDVEVRFAARDFGTFGTTLAVQSNDPVAPTVSSALQGSYAEVMEVNVAVSQIQACPRELPAKAYVSVTDQAGFPIRGLGLPDFGLLEIGSEAALFSVESVTAANATLSLSILMDYSNTIKNSPGALENMEEAASLLAERLGELDEADVAKFSFFVKFMLEDFSSDKEEVLAAIAADPELPGGSRIHDALLEVIDRIKGRTKDRKAVVILTDGRDSSDDTELSTVIAAALEDDIPVFPVGFGNVNDVDLAQLADDTGGVYYEPAAAENLAAVYQQLANLLFADQYVLGFDSSLAADESGLLEVAVDFFKDGEAFAGSGSKTSLACPAP
jgi:VWFA-related protein